MLSTAMQQYCYPTAGAQAPKTGMPYYVGEPQPSPTFLSHSPLSLYTRPPQFPFSAPSSVTQGLFHGPPAPGKVTLGSNNAVAAATLLALGQQQTTPGESASPGQANCEPMSPIKLEQLSPESAATPPISVTNEADSSTTNEQTAATTYESPQGPASGLSLPVSEPGPHQDTASIASYPTIPANMYTDATRISCPQVDVAFSAQTPSFQLPYSHSPSYTQPALGSYTAIRYPPPTPTMTSPIGYFPQIHTPRRDEVFPRNNSCHMCGKTYARQSTLKTHLRSHSGEKPYQCSICQKSFTQAANLTAHLRTHSGEKPFKCPICNRGFSQSSSVTTHMRTHSGDRPYKCTVCSKGFADSSTLTKHFRTHTGEKPYQCKICDARFSQSGNLNRHMRTHRNHFPVLGHLQ